MHFLVERKLESCLEAKERPGMVLRRRLRRTPAFPFFTSGLRVTLIDVGVALSTVHRAFVAFF
jgi:hypothetical protein